MPSRPDFLFPLRRLAACLDPRRRRRGFGVQSPFAFAFVKQVVCGKRAGLKARLKAFAEAQGFRLLALPAGNPPDMTSLAPQLSETTLLFFPAPYRNRPSLQTWREMAADPRATFVFDCYAYGILFYRRAFFKQTYLLHP